MADAERQPLVRKRSKRPAFRLLRKQERAYRPSTWDVVILAAVAAFGILAWQISASFVRRHDDPRRRSYPGEKITWTSCGTLVDHQLECTNLTVPMDHFNSSNNGPDNSLHFTIPLIRLRGKNATDNINILLNPGGPGGSGAEFIWRWGAQLNTIIGENYHLLTFDPRGVNGSVPRANCYPTEEIRRELSVVRNKKIVEDSGELWAWAGNFVQACADNMGVHGAYINTPQTAADMNSILDAIGQDDMYYWGFSYGTLLGQTYATLFPERSKRVIIDGVVNQFSWYNNIFDDEDLTDTDNVFDGFVDECIKAGKEDCALAELASSKEQLREKLITSIDQLRDDPIGVYVNTSIHGVLDYWAVWYDGVFPAMYKPANWRTLADNLAALLKGNATAAFMAYSREGPWVSLFDANTVIMTNDGVSGPKNWPVSGRQELVKQVIDFYNSSTSRLFNTALSHEGHFEKQAWKIPRTHNYVPTKGVKTAHPLLVLTTTYDPICPLVSAKSANDAFVDSKIVEVKGYGHCSLAVPSLCINKHVRAFLDEGKLPDDYTQCEGDGNPYFGKSDDEKKGLVNLQSSSWTEEEKRIHLAQVELARDLWFKPRWQG
ncbi:Alpha/Beta hydrolase protein [Podospora australis]|uniref:Alpha/Beta hydrolase protein n=1 Tax=Podospora australis TaxID=1536484 RepID=A0AAN6WJ71_9PEZI|nr:Alpha/Beta hydrolase protein [Podospora australis]